MKKLLISLVMLPLFLISSQAFAGITVIYSNQPHARHFGHVPVQRAHFYGHRHYAPYKYQRNYRGYYRPQRKFYRPNNYYRYGNRYHRNRTYNRGFDRGYRKGYRQGNRNAQRFHNDRRRHVQGHDQRRRPRTGRLD